MKRSMAATCLLGLLALGTWGGAELQRMTMQSIMAKVNGGEYVGRENYCLQRRKGECGPVALENLMIALGRTPPRLNDILAMFEIKDNEVTFRQIKQVAGELGLQTKLLDLRGTGIDSVPCPCILFFEDKHFVTLVARDKDRATIVDPAVGIMRYDVRALLKRWRGPVLACSSA